jgi:type II secretory pathway pseudopilin PulG
MLTVIAVIGLLAALVAGLSSLSGAKSRQNRIKAELNLLVTAIENYQADFGHYPPDHLVPQPSSVLVDAVTNQLFYELTGVIVTNDVVNNTGQFYTAGRTETITTGTVKDFFGTDGFVNAQTDTDKPPRAYFQPKSSQYAEISGPPPAGPDVEVLVVPVKWPLNRADQPTGRKGVNPWRYVSTQPTNNMSSFDLWAEWVERKEVKILSNWNPDPQDKK